MDQLQQYWEIIKKQHFWILSGLAVLVPLVVCWFASGKLSKAYSEQVTKISGTNSNLEPLTSGDHANEVWIKHVNDETDALRRNVLAAWKKMYLEQQAVLKWPAGLPKEFISAFSGTSMPTDPDAISSFSARYQTFVKVELADLAGIIGAEWKPASENNGVVRSANPTQPVATAKKATLVTWSPEDQQKLNKEFDWPTPPSPVAIKYAQEELWVRQAIFEAIARTNAGATGDFDATIHSIDRSLIGYDASDKYPLSEGSGRLVRNSTSETALRGVAIATSVAGAGPFEPKRPVAGVVDVLTGPGAPAGPVDPDTALKDGRYVDEKGTPLHADGIDNTTSPEYHLLAFKLNIVADEQRWPKLLVELSNSPLPLEVREIRVDPKFNPESHEVVTSSISSHQHFDETGTGMIRHDLPIEIYGFAYIMKPPDYAKLGIAADSPDATAPAGAAQPAATGAPTNTGAPIAAPAPAGGTTTGSAAPAPASNSVPAPVAPAGTSPPAATSPVGPRGPADKS